MNDPFPYKIAVLCYLFDEEDRVLLIHRRRPPNLGLYSPIGGKLKITEGESPGKCAVREIEEETGLRINGRDLHLAGIVSEADYEDRNHWLMFLYEVIRPVQVDRRTCGEGQLEWHAREAVAQLAIPRTDQEVIWPLFWSYRGRFFSVHINCRGGDLNWHQDQPTEDCTWTGGWHE